MKTNVVTGLQLIDYDTPFTCKSCLASKSTRKEIYKHRHTPLASAFGGEVFSDIWVAPLESLGGCQYYITFIDDHMHYLTVDFLQAKSNTLEAYKAYSSWVHTQFGIQIKHFHSDAAANTWEKILPVICTSKVWNDALPRLTPHSTMALLKQQTAAARAHARYAPPDWLTKISMG